MEGNAIITPRKRGRENAHLRLMMAHKMKRKRGGGVDACAFNLTLVPRGICAEGRFGVQLRLSEGGSFSHVDADISRVPINDRGIVF